MAHVEWQIKHLIHPVYSYLKWVAQRQESTHFERIKYFYYTLYRVNEKVTRGGSIDERKEKDEMKLIVGDLFWTWKKFWTK